MYHAVEKITGFILILLFLLFSFGCDLQNGENGGETGTETIEVKVGVDKISSGGTAIDFGEVLIGQESNTIEIKVENTGEESLGLTAGIECSDTNNFTCSTFDETSEETLFLEQYEFAKLKIHFNPETIGNHEAELTITYSDDMEFKCSVRGTCIGDGHLKIVDTYTTTISVDVFDTIWNTTAVMPLSNDFLYLASTDEGSEGESTDFQLLNFNEDTDSMTPADGFPYTHSNEGTGDELKLDVSYNQEYLYYCDMQKFFIFSRNTSNGSLTFEREILADEINGAKWIKSHNTKPFIYLHQGNGSDPEVMVYDNPDLSGTPIDTLSPGWQFGIYDAMISESGNFLYLRYFDHPLSSEILCYAIDETIGTLTQTSAYTNSFIEDTESSCTLVEDGYIYIGKNGILTDGIDYQDYKLCVLKRDIITGKMEMFKTIDIVLPKVTEPEGLWFERINTFIPFDGKNIFFIYTQNIENQQSETYIKSFIFSYYIDKKTFEVTEIAGPEEIDLSSFQGVFSDDGKYFIMFGPKEDKEYHLESDLKIQVAKRVF